jgi:FemAB-related protein (PEP-CTERM system-associated)
MTLRISDSPVRANEPLVKIDLLQGARLQARMPALTRFVMHQPSVALSAHPKWLAVLHTGLGHKTYALEAVEGDQTVGFLPLAFLQSRLFGRFLVSLPYLNSAGACAQILPIRTALVSNAIDLADELRVRFLELRHQSAIEHQLLAEPQVQKIHMRLPLPGTTDELWKDLDCKVRNQVRKGEKAQLSISWGGSESLADFYAVFSRNMRDLGTPVFPRKLFGSILQCFPAHSELCVVKKDNQAIAGALLLHGKGITEVPSASSLREFNFTNANMLMYWHLLQRAVQRGQAQFDFGRSSPLSTTFQFKKQWGAVPTSAAWQYYRRQGSIAQMRPDNPRYRWLIRAWTRLPLWMANTLGPGIARLIP